MGEDYSKWSADDTYVVEFIKQKLGFSDKPVVETVVETPVVEETVVETVVETPVVEETVVETVVETPVVEETPVPPQTDE